MTMFIPPEVADEVGGDADETEVYASVDLTIREGGGHAVAEWLNAQLKDHGRELKVVVTINADRVLVVAELPEDGDEEEGATED